MNKIADLIEQRLDEFAEAESRDSGKPVHLAKAVDIPRVILNFRFFASAIVHYTSTWVFPLSFSLSVFLSLHENVTDGRILTGWSIDW